MQDNLLTVTEVSVLIGSSPSTITQWYRWKKLNPEHPMAQLLPDCIQQGSRTIRLWRQEDVYKLIEFKKNIPHGRNGIFGDITQRYWREKQVKKKKGKKDGKNSNRRKTERASRTRK